jgi:hypothetical protein
MNLIINKLPNGILSGDWHDQPLRWEVVGPASERQMFATKRDATTYARMRRNSGTQQVAIRQFAMTA